MPRNAPITKRTATKRTATKPARHRTTKANGNLFADLGFAPLESASLQLRARLMAELIRMSGPASSPRPRRLACSA